MNRSTDPLNPSKVTNMTKSAVILISLLFVSMAAAAEMEPAPALALTDDTGTVVNLPRSHNGVDVYFFWASWCPYCKALMPHLQSINEEYGDRVTIFALQIRDDEDPRAFLDRYGYDFVLLPDADAAMEPYGVKGTPGVFLVDGSGNIRFNLYDLRSDDDAAYQALNHSGKAARRAPWWAARIRQATDEILHH